VQSRDRRAREGQLVREVDALAVRWALHRPDGHPVQDAQRGKGPAVWSPRAQADKKAYHERMMKALEGERNLDILEGEIARVMLRAGAQAASPYRAGARSRRGR